MITTLALAVASGALVGFSLGLIGGGGSILATPLLLYVVGLSPTHVAIGTGALAVAVNAFANLFGHACAGNVRWRYAIVFAAVGSLGAIAGSSLGKIIDGNYLLVLFGLVMVAIAVAMLRQPRENLLPERDADFSTYLQISAIAFLAGTASGFFGIGGGFLIVPSLMATTWMPMIKAVGSSLLAVGTFGLATAINYALSGLVDWTIAIAFIAGGVIAGVPGMRLASRLSCHKNTLKQTFSLFILGVAAYILYRGYLSFRA